MLSKIIDISVPLSDIRDNTVVAISGFNMANTPEYLILQLYHQYTKNGHPKNLFIISDALPAVPGRALDRVAENLYKDPNQEFLKGVLMPFLGFSPWLQKLVINNRVECYGWPIGITAYWFREVASGRPGLLTKIGVDTFLDPRNDGAVLNQQSRKDGPCKVSLLDIEGTDYLLFQAPKPDYALIRATISDEYGNLSLREEGIRGTILSIAQAAKARPHSGSVIAQVRWLTKSGTISPRDVDVPGPLINHVVVSPREYHWQSGTIENDPRLSYMVTPPITESWLEGLPRVHSHEHERVIARRILLELLAVLKKKRAPILVNLGIGIPALISSVGTEEGISDFIITVLESGPWGGLALSGNDFGLAISPFALSTIPDVFSNFEGGIIDAASLGFLQVDNEGNVNPSMLPNKIFGPGGFPVIAGGAPRIFFGGAFTAGKSDIRIANNRINILRDGSTSKFVEKVFKVGFSGHQALKYGQEVLYVTERAVFKLGENNIVLQEIAPGIDLDRDVYSKMSFLPNEGSIKEMDERIFNNGKMDVKADLLSYMS
jgi:acyl CoA:acetate/3-ketoacid CoA transferase